MENSVIKTILDRRSIRKYKDQAIDQALLEQLVDVSLQAPSARNLQSARMIITRDQELLNRMDDCFLEVMRSGGRDIEKGYLFHGAPTVIFLAHSDLSGNPADGHADAGILSQTIALCAKSLDLGTCIVGLISYLRKHPQCEAFYKELQVPDGFVIDLCVTVGYADEDPTAKPRKLPAIWQS